MKNINISILFLSLFILGGLSGCGGEEEATDSAIEIEGAEEAVNQAKAVEEDSEQEGDDKD